MLERFVMVHNVLVHILSDSSNVLELLLNELYGFTVYEKISASEQVRISIESCDSLSPQPNSGKVYEDKGGVVKFFDSVRQINRTYYCDDVSICVGLDSSSVYNIQCQYRTGYTNYLDITSELIYELVYRVLITFGFFPLHSGCVINKQNHCVILCGNSFRGKTTLCISALEHGYKILSDDMILLKTNRKSIEAYSFPRTLRICNDTLEHFPNLHKHIAYNDREFLYLRNDIAISPDCVPKDVAEKMRRGHKARILLNDVYDNSLIHCARPICLVLLTQGNTYCCRKITSQEAFNAILKDNMMIYSFRGAGKKTYENFSEIIQHLVLQCESLEVGLGIDLNENCEKFVQMADSI